MKENKETTASDKQSSAHKVSYETPYNVDNYIVQNKLLAMKNSTMAQQIAEMELRNGELIKENMMLNQRGEGASDKMHHTMDFRLSHIERIVLGKLSEILSTLLKIREEEGLPANPVVSAISEVISRDSQPVTTSTPTVEKQGSFLGQDAVCWAGELLKSISPAVTTLGNSPVPSVADVAMLEDESKSESSAIDTGEVLPDMQQGVYVQQDENEPNPLPADLVKSLSPGFGTKRSLNSMLDQPLDRTSRRKPVNYEIAKLNRKLRRQTSALADAASNNILGNNLEHGNTDIQSASVSAASSDNHQSLEKMKGSKLKKERKPLANITNRSRTTLLRKAKSINHKDEVPDKDIFEFVEPDELENQARGGLLKRRKDI